MLIPPLMTLVRPLNALIAGASVGVGAACLPGPYPLQTVLLGALAMAALSGGGNAENDVIDIEVDRRNRPRRPVASGAVSPAQALTLAYALYAFAIGMAAWVSPAHGALAAGMALLLIVYNRSLKGRPLWGNLAVALLCGLALVFCEWPSLPQLTSVAAGFAFLSTLAREVLKDLEDRPGDAALGLRTLPLAYGEGLARGLALALTLALLVLLPMPIWLYEWHRGYGFLAMVGPAPLLLGIGLKLSTKSGTGSRQIAPDYGRLQQRYKGVMLAGLVALLGGALLSRAW